MNRTIRHGSKDSADWSRALLPNVVSGLLNVRFRIVAYSLVLFQPSWIRLMTGNALTGTMEFLRFGVKYLLTSATTSPVQTTTQ